MGSVFCVLDMKAEKRFNKDISDLMLNLLKSV